MSRVVAPIQAFPRPNRRLAQQDRRWRRVVFLTVCPTLNITDVKQDEVWKLGGPNSPLLINVKEERT